MEKWDVYDGDRKLTGRTMERGACADGDYHLVVNVCIFNTHGEMLIQKRSDDKESCPGLWDFSAGGSAQAGEDSRTAAIRETKEELGLDVELDAPAITMRSAHAFCDFYVIVKDLHRDEVVLQESELSAIGGANEKRIRELIKEGQFVPYRVNLVKLLFDLRDGNGPKQA